MTKSEFLDALRTRLSGLPQSDVEERLLFYSEMIDDRIEEGSTEEEAVSKIGSINEIVENIESEIQLTKSDSNSVKAKRSSGSGLEAWKIVLLILGAPIWFSLLVGLLACVFSVFVSLWAVAVTFWGIAIGFIVGGPVSVLLGAIFIFIKSGAEGLAMIGAGLVLTGVAIIFIFVSRLFTKLLISLTKNLFVEFKKAFAKKGE